MQAAEELLHADFFTESWNNSTLTSATAWFSERRTTIANRETMPEPAEPIQLRQNTEDGQFKVSHQVAESQYAWAELFDNGTELKRAQGYEYRGDPIGWWRRYRADGSLQKAQTHYRDTKTGPIEFWSANEKLIAAGRMADRHRIWPRRAGVWTFWHRYRSITGYRRLRMGTSTRCVDLLVR